MKVLVIGATGLTGQIAVRRLLDRGDEVTALARDPAAIVECSSRPSSVPMRPAISCFAVAALLVEGRALASTIMVGPGDDYTKIEAAQAGDTVLIQPGTYQFRVYLSGTGTAAMPITIQAADPKNPPVWDLGGKPVNQWPGSYTGGDNDRGCWQVGGGAFYVIEGIVFQNCRNGIDAAGIRTHASTSLRVRDVHIHDCDDGFTGDGTDTVVEFSELDHNGYVPASQETHNIYIYDGDFTLRYSFVHDSTHGQNFHIRAQNALLEYNWIARAQNYEGDMASTGTPGKQSMTLRGNVILGNLSPENHGQLLALSNDSGAGGYTFDLTAVWNTMIVQTPTNPVLVNVVNDTLDAASVTFSNNILVGTNAMIVPGDPAKSNTTVQGTNNWMETGAAPGGLMASIMGAAPGFKDAMNLDFTLAPGSMAIGAASAGVMGAPTEEYFQNETVKERFRFRLSAKDLGAFEHDTMGMSYGPYDSPTAPGTSSSSGAGSGGASGSSGGAGAAGTGGSAQASGSGGGSSGQKGGCGCREAPAGSGSPAAIVLLAGLAAAAAGSRRRRNIAALAPGRAPLYHRLLEERAMASKEQEELVEKLQKLLVRRYGNTGAESMRRLFDEYDRDKDQKISPAELETLLKDADIGNSFTRGAWVKGVIGALDQNADRNIDWNEFTAAIK